MITEPPDNNPYTAPKASDWPLPRTSLSPTQRIEFSGTVRRSQLREALRTRISWSGLGTLGVITLICFAASPSSLMLPRAPARFPIQPDLMGELIRVIGLGFVVISIWHIVATCTTWGLNRREQALRYYSPNLYEAPTQGYLHIDHIYLNQKNGEIWLAWDAVGACQFGLDLILIQWSNGVFGSSVLTREMFSSPDAYDQAVQLFVDQSDPHRRGPKSDSAYFMSEESNARAPREEACIARMECNLDFPSPMRTALIEIPLTICRSSTPLHVFFAILAGLALIVTTQKALVTLIIGGVWCSIMLLASLLSVWQQRKLLFPSSQSSFASKYAFLQEEMHIAIANAYFIVPIKTFIADHITADRIELRQAGHPMSHVLERRHFDSDEDYRAVCDLFLATSR